MPAQIDGAVGVLGDLAAVAVNGDLAAVCSGGHILNIVTHGQHHLIGDKTVFHQIQHQPLRHFADNEAGLVEGIRVMQYLPGADTAGLGLVGLDVGNGTRLPAPCVVDQQLGIDPEQLIEQLVDTVRAPIE